MIETRRAKNYENKSKNKNKSKSKNKNKNKSKNKLVNVETILEKHHALFVQHRSYFILGEFQWNGWE